VAAVVNPYTEIADELVARLRSALAPLAHLTDDDIINRSDLSPPEAQLIIATRRTVEEYDR
jgi:hypothetical protein